MTIMVTIDEKITAWPNGYMTLCRKQSIEVKIAKMMSCKPTIDSSSSPSTGSAIRDRMLAKCFCKYDN